MRAHLLGMLALMTGLAASPALGETARQILDRRRALDDGPRRWENRHERMRLRIVDRRGSERTREIDLYERREKSREKKAILFFLAPAEVKGTGFLAFTSPTRPAEQWLYLPELKRVRQITARARNESFVGTDLSYHDLDLLAEMTDWTEEDARSSLRGEESVEASPCHVIELVPQRDDIGYRRLVLWLARDDLVPRRLEFYGEESEPAKRIEQRDVRAIGAIPVAHAVKVMTPAKGSHTAIEVSEVAFDQRLEDDLFSQRYLLREGR
jgi:hypothetical protein